MFHKNTIKYLAHTTWFSISNIVGKIAKTRPPNSADSHEMKAFASYENTERAVAKTTIQTISGLEEKNEFKIPVNLIN